MTAPTSKTRAVELAELGDRFSALRLCDAKALRMMVLSLERYGQLSPLTVFVEDEGLQILDGFKRVRAAMRLGFSKLMREWSWSGASTRSCGSRSCTRGAA